MVTLIASRGGGGGTLYGPYGEAFRPRVNKTVGISLDKVYERVGKSVISVCKIIEKAYRRIAWL